MNTPRGSGSQRACHDPPPLLPRVKVLAVGPVDADILKGGTACRMVLARQVKIRVGSTRAGNCGEQLWVLGGIATKTKWLADVELVDSG